MAYDAHKAAKNWARKEVRKQAVARHNENQRMRGVSLNRSKHWAYAKSYEDARTSSPSVSPVR